jgi:hypothetical protein
MNIPLPNGTLSLDPEHGHIWTTKCRKCGTTQRIKIGRLSLSELKNTLHYFDVPGECPGGYHVEMGFRHYWSIDLMVSRYAALFEAPPLPAAA